MTSTLLSAEDEYFKPQLRQDAEAAFKSRADKPDFVEYEFVDYPGELRFFMHPLFFPINDVIEGTVHGFASRPNMAYPEAKDSFEKAFAAAVRWFKKTLG